MVKAERGAKAGILGRNEAPPLRPEVLRFLVTQALEEDVGPGDATTNACVPVGDRASARAVARTAGVVAGLAVFAATFQALSPEVTVTHRKRDGDKLTEGDVVSEVAGPARAILTGERVALNFLQRMSGIATQTARFVEAVAGAKAAILDTRKTAPGLRILDKYAVWAGGGRNHRMGLYDAMLIKDNHIAAAGSVAEAVKRARAGMPSRTIVLEVECDTFEQVAECLQLGVELILLDNMSVDEMARAVALGAGRARFEASGSIDLDNVAAVARAGVDFISVGSLTHSVRALDIGLDFK